MPCRHIAVAAGLLAWSGSALGQAVTTIGSSAAEACYHAARDRHIANADLAGCNRALKGTQSLPDVVATHVNRGILFALRGSYSDAMRDYDRAITLDPGQAEAHLNKGLLLLRMPGRDAEAIATLSAAIAKQTTMPALAFFARAVANEGLGDLGAAYRDYRQAAAMAPDWPLPARELARFKTKS